MITEVIHNLIEPLIVAPGKMHLNGPPFGREKG